MAHSPDEMDFKQYYEDWRHRDTLTWQIPAVTVVIGSGIIIGSYMAEIPWCVKALAFGLGAFFSATLTVMLAQNLYYQWRDEKHLEDYRKKKNDKPQSDKADEKDKKNFWNKLCQKLRLIEDYGREENDKPQSRPIPRKVDEEDKKRRCRDKLGRILGPQRMGSTLLLITCFFFYGGLSCLFASTWQWCSQPYLAGGISVLVITPVLTFGWFLLWLKCQCLERK